MGLDYLCLNSTYTPEKAAFKKGSLLEGVTTFFSTPRPWDPGVKGGGIQSHKEYRLRWITMDCVFPARLCIAPFDTRFPEIGSGVCPHCQHGRWPSSAKTPGKPRPTTSEGSEDRLSFVRKAGCWWSGGTVPERAVRRGGCGGKRTRIQTTGPCSRQRAKPEHCPHQRYECDGRFWQSMVLPQTERAGGEWRYASPSPSGATPP